MHADFDMRERFLVGRWLTYRSHDGVPPDLRAFFAEMFFEPLAPENVKGWLAWVEHVVGELAGQPLTLAHTPPIGRGLVTAEAGDNHFASLSSWEHAWLVANDVKQRGELASPVAALTRVAEHQVCDPFAALLSITLCLDELEDAMAFVRAVDALDDREVWVTGTYDAARELEREAAPRIQAWVRWLARGGRPPTKLVDSYPLPVKAVERALAGRWRDAEAALPPALQKTFTTAARRRPVGSTAGRLVAQLVSHALHVQPSRRVIDRSLANCFAFWGMYADSPWWELTDVEPRLAPLALHARLFDRAEPGVALLHDMRRHNEHLTAPIGSTFTTPADVLAMAEALLAVFRFAAERDLWLTRTTLPSGGVRFQAAPAADVV
jgi:hypothetical protein